MISRNTENCSAEILRGVLQNYWKVFYRVIERSSTLNSVFDNKQLLRVKSITNFWYSLKHKKDNTADRRSYDLQIWRNKIDDKYKNRNGPRPYSEWPLLTFCHLLSPFLVTPSLPLVRSFLNELYQKTWKYM